MPWGLIGAEYRYLYYVKSKLHNLTFLLKTITVSIRENLRTNLTIELTGFSYSVSLFLLLLFADHFSTSGRGTKPFNTEVSGQIQFVLSRCFEPNKYPVVSRFAFWYAQELY